jgi:Protein of unknown function (DUF4232)
MKTPQATLCATALMATLMATIGPPASAHADPAIGGCAPEALAVATEAAQPGLGHRAVQLVFTLQPGAAACQLSGYPTVDAQPQVEGAAPVHAKQTPGGYLGGAKPDTSVTLEPGRGARAMVEWVAGSPGMGCAIYGAPSTDVQLAVTPPGTTQAFTVPISVGRNEGLCMFQVHPVTGA